MSRFTKYRKKARAEKAERIRRIDDGFSNIISALEDMRDNPQKYMKKEKK